MAQLSMALDGRQNTARFSPCGTYRYELTRENLPSQFEISDSDRPLVICGLNPSTATAETDDQTIRKEIGFAKLWGCGRLVKVNAYAYRATDPNDMKRARRAGVDIVGPDNERWIRNAVELARTCKGITLVAWGGHIEKSWQAELAYIFGDDAMCLGTNGDGTPKHPLYLSYETPLVYWSCP